MSAASSMSRVLITGANRGLGLGLTAHYLSLPTFNLVIATCRSPSEELTQLEKSHPDRLLVLPLDVASEESQAGFSEALKARNIDTIDILIANAGISSRHHPVDPAVTCSVDDMTNVYATNCVGSLLSLQHHTPRLLASRTKLAVLISSVMGSTTKVQEAAQRGSLSYRVSKAALNMMAVTYANEPEIKEGGMRILCMHPGWVQTDMGSSGGRVAPVTVDQSIAGMAAQISRASLFQHGGEGAAQPQPDDAEFERKLGSGCVFVDFEGSLLPW